MEKQPHRETEAFVPHIEFAEYYPERVITNQEIESWNVRTPGGSPLTAADLQKRTGIDRRYVANSYETPFQMGYAVTGEVMRKMKRDVDALFVTTSFPQGRNLSENLTRALELRKIFHLDVHAACSGFVRCLTYMLENKEKFADAKVIITATEKYSPYLYDLRNPAGIEKDPSLAQTLFSDGAVAIGFQNDQDLSIRAGRNLRLPDSVSGYLKMPVESELARDPYLEEPVACSASGKFEQDGRKVFREVLSNVPGLIYQTIEDAGLAPEDIQCVIPHQGSGGIVEGLAGRLKDLDVVSDFNQGNFSSASIPKALNRTLQEGKIRRGDNVVLAGFGAGLFASVAVVQFH